MNFFFFFYLLFFIEFFRHPEVFGQQLLQPFVLIMIFDILKFYSDDIQYIAKTMWTSDYHIHVCSFFRLLEQIGSTSCLGCLTML